MARTNLGRVVPLHKGGYSATIGYELNDIVSYNGSTYWHFTHDKTTGILPTDTSVWKLVIDMADAEQYIARAETAALQAEGDADDAQSAKTAAETAKDDAETAEEGAVSAKQDALASEENARSYMTAAQTAKGQAESARDLAIQAKTDAVDAKQGAESAKDTAISAKNTAVDAKNTAVSAKEAALTAQGEAEDAAETASVAKDTAVSAKTAAETAKDDAETAEGNASTSATNAEESAEDAEAWAVGKRDGVDVPSTDPAYHNNAKYFAGQAETTTQAVKYVEQALTDSQKSQARENIGAAATDGYYGQMGVGLAEQLISTVGVIDKVPYNFRTAGGSADIGNRLNDKIVGGTIVWNQLVQNGNFESTSGWSATSTTFSVENNIATFLASAELGRISQAIDFVLNHKYFIRFDAKSTGSQVVFVRLNISGASADIQKTLSENWQTFTGITNIASNGEGMYIANRYNETILPIYLQNVELIDLTTMFGSTIADYVYSIEQATAGAGVTWFNKLFPKPYYEYNSGELMSVCTNAHITRGFNAWDEEWEAGFINIATGLPQYLAGYIRSKNFIRVEHNKEYYFKCPTNLLASDQHYIIFYDANKDMISNVSRLNATFVTPYNCAYIKFYVTSANETYNHDICINLSWSGYRNGEYEPYVEHRYPLSDVELRGIPKLDTSNNLYYDGDIYESIGKVTRKYEYRDYEEGDDSLPDTITDGIHTVTKLTTPTIETTNPFTDLQIVNDFGTEEYVDALATAETSPRDVKVPVGHETFYQANLRDKLQNLPSNAGADGLYLVKQTGNKQELIAYTPESELPTVSSEGTYSLKSVNGVLTWVAE